MTSEIPPILPYLSATICGTAVAVPKEPAPEAPIVSDSEIFPSPLVYVIPLTPASNPLALVLKFVTWLLGIATALSPAAVIKPFAFIYRNII